MISYLGYNFATEHVTAISPVVSISTGGAACDWDCGVQVHLRGTIMDIRFHTRDSDTAEKQRRDLIGHVTGDWAGIL